ncbi:carbohydrate kinase [Mycobacterium lentiflavum]|uniref:Carbohydrate kinase n=1 Tax=Mycobacterium lentiflavum TaxID=141349 RepID=A0A0E4H582_MYCLN|nr:FGGY-family carbohydrate kinase [Mycobacterium lentiflavum]CQD22913.1 carbohydrate kinase [Mycobacterium lentiflavum]
MDASIVLGVDVGSQGARVMAVDWNGTVLGTGSRGWVLHRGAEGRHEQDPRDWLRASREALGEATAEMSAPQRQRIAALAVTSTSGTLVLADSYGNPIAPAIMWSDTRAGRQADALADPLADFTERTGLRIRGSFPVAKLAWLAEHDPILLDRAAVICHAGDWLLWQLGVGKATTDPTNAFKTGYDPTAGAWDPILTTWGLADRLPDIADSATPLGCLDSRLAAQLGLPATVVLTGAMTDANTAMLAAGVVEPGRWLTTLGTGLSIKGVRVDRLIDPTGAVYCHRDPQGHWLPSGTSHCGGAEVTVRFGRELDSLSKAAEKECPGAMIVYPLPGRGDYFPRWNPAATAFRVGTASRAGEFRATLEGIAVIENLAYRRLQELGAQVPDTIVSVGGATRSPLWNTIRASIQGRSLQTMQRPDTAIGAAATAFAALGAPVATVVQQIVHHGPAIEPDAHLHNIYQDLVLRYQQELALREGQ